MMKCRARKFIDNSAVVSTPHACFGGNGQPECEHLDNCILQNNQKLLPREVNELNFDPDTKVPGPEGAR